jgi:2-polyprenyl-3-methyl-5-hydroxy-6-metoxy-1,4-benzoquinol methylase
MKPNKYFDWRLNKPLTEADGCNFAEWERNDGQHAFAIHSKGYFIFMASSELGSCDEYKSGDPYTVEQRLEEPFHQRRISVTLELVHHAINDRNGSARILDLGCGEGHITMELARRFPEAEISGLDYAISAVDKAASICESAEFVVSDAYTAPYLPGYFDLVICNNLWEHVPDPLRLLSVIGRITRTNGYVIISTPSRYRLSNLLRAVRGKCVSFMSPLHITEYSVGQMVEMMRSGGYEVESVKSKRMHKKSGSWKAWVLQNLIHPALDSGLRLMGSHHSLESTVFYLAKKK